jgi:apolipoprotein N-acyltransferase
VFAEDLPALTLRAARLAREHRVYLVMGVDVLYPGRDIFENLAIVLTPEGRIAITYRKSHPVFAEFGGERAVRGDGRIPFLDTPYGRFAVAICYDMDFPRLIRQAGKAGAGVLLVPALDWREISPYHSFVALFRGIENGCAVVRQTDHGMSLAADYQGTVVSGMDYFTAESRTMLFNIPAKGTATFYSLAGDWVVCGIMLFWLVQIPLLLSDAVKKTGRHGEEK